MTGRIPIIIIAVAMSAAPSLPAAEGSSETRKREFASIQKEIEAARPEENASREEIMAFLELLMEKYGKFAQANPKSPEGFDAAFMAASMLMQMHHPRSARFAKLALESAPAAGVDMKRVAQCWATLAGSRLGEGDAEAAHEALDKIKPIAPEIYEQLAAQFKQAEAEMAEYVEKVGKVVGKAPHPISGADTSGKKVSLSDFAGKVVVIDFWASWCGPCMQEMPHLVELYKEQHGKGLEVLGVSWDKDDTSRDAAIAKHGMGWPVITDTDHSISEKWEVNAIPCTIVIDRKGIVRKVYLRGDALADAVSKLIDEH